MVHSNNDFEDALQDAYFGLVDAVRTYDEEKGYKFMTHADYHIMKAITQGKRGMYQIPEHLLQKAKKIRRVENELAQKFMRTPTLAEIAFNVDMKVEDVQSILQITLPQKGLDEPIADEMTVADTLIDKSIDFENDVAVFDQHKRLHKAMDVLTSRESYMIRLHFFRNLSYKDIAKEMKISPQRIQQIINKSIQKLRNPDIVKQLVDEEVDCNTLFYKHSGVNTFNNTWTSATEQVVLTREEKHEKFIMTLNKQTENMSAEEKADEFLREINNIFARLEQKDKKYNAWKKKHNIPSRRVRT